MKDFVPLAVSREAPGAASARRGHIAVRPGNPDYVEMQLRALCDHIATDPGIVSLLGRDITIGVSMGDHGRHMRFDIRKLPGSPKIKDPR